MTGLPTTDHWSESDWGYIFPGGYSSPDAFAAEPGGQRLEVPSEDDVAEVTDFYATSNEGGERGPGTEQMLYAVLRLNDGRWAAVYAWNDYTGWGCRDGIEWRIGASREQVVRNGLDAPGREALGLTVSS